MGSFLSLVVAQRPCSEICARLLRMEDEPSQLESELDLPTHACPWQEIMHGASLSFVCALIRFGNEIDVQVVPESFCQQPVNSLFFAQK